MTPGDFVTFVVALTIMILVSRAIMRRIPPTYQGGFRCQSCQALIDQAFFQKEGPCRDGLAYCADCRRKGRCGCG